MAAIVTKLAGPFYRQGPGGVGYTISVALDASHAAGGEPIDLTSYLSYFYGASYKGSDAAADEAMMHTINGPGKDVAVSSTNVLVQVHHSSGADAAMNAADAEDLSSHGALIFDIWGKKNIVTSWA